MNGILRVSCLLAVAGIASCRAGSGERARAPASLEPALPAMTATGRPGVVTAAPSSAPEHGAAAAEPTTVIADPVVLRRLEESGFDAGTLVVGDPGSSTLALGAHPAFRTVRDAVAADLAEGRSADAAAGVGMRFAHRQFDVRWLSSDKTRFDLIAVVNRLDRRAFFPERCGEVRFVYRLAYRTETATGPVESRLPMTLNVVSYQDVSGPDACRAVARAWMRPPEARDGERQLAWLLSAGGPLSAARRAATVPKSVEINFQSVRWPSTVRPSMAGHAEYVLRVFHRTDAAPFLAPAPLEDTIDVPRVTKNSALRADLLGFLSSPATLAKVDEGTLLVPERFLATRAVSVSPHGLARRGNRPYSAVFGASDFAGAALSSYPTASTPAALLRRLDALSCPGCHQSRSIAGFHLLGVEPESDQVDALAVPMSPHFHAELERRRAYVAAVAEGAPPVEHRPPAERGPGDDGEGARCGLGDAGFATWTCAPGLRCERGSDSDVGVCVPASGVSVGDPCEVGSISASVNPHTDRMTLGRSPACPANGVCEANSVGFPDGMCSGGCDALPPGAVCGGIALLTEFNACLGRGTSFDRCIADNTRPGALRGCSFHTPCRDDYVCARSGAQGVCMPPYFLFQLRVDGHPL